jgi:hypothetical protein
MTTRARSKQASPLVFEHRLSPLLPAKAFRSRQLRMALIGAVMIAVSLIVGMLGYHFIAGQSWPDSYLNASMILSGMGPVGELNSTAAKIFAGTYALYSGLALIVIAGIVLSPTVHRFLHKFHLEAGKKAGGE